MCDFSLQSMQSRPARVDDKLVTRDFGIGTRGSADVDNLGTAVCLMPGTELAFAGDVTCRTGLLGWPETIKHQTAIFRQVNKEKSAAHHDALEFPDGRTVLLTNCEQARLTVWCSCPRSRRRRPRRASRNGSALSGEILPSHPR